MRHDTPSLQLAPNDEAMEEMATTHTVGHWEQYIIDHLISCCEVEGLELIEVNSSLDSEESALGYDEDEPGPMAKSEKEKRRRKQKQDAGNILLQCCNGMAG